MNQLDEATFYLYGSEKQGRVVSIFDLIGHKEPDQTKSLAYLFSQYRKFLLDFLKMPPLQQAIKQKIPGFSLGQIQHVVISAEMQTRNEKGKLDRADIIIRLNNAKGPLLAVIIEAKSLKVKVDAEALKKQIEEQYLIQDAFPR
jgi:hypothetical protein